MEYHDQGSLAELLAEIAAEVMGEDQPPMVQRARDAVIRRAPRIRRAAKSAPADVMGWMQQGGPWRAFLVSTLGIIVFVSLAALATFMLFFATATANAIAIGFLMSVSAVGAFVAVFFVMLTAVYVGALLTAAVAISSIALCTMSAVVLATGWILFCWCLWQGAKKTIDFVRAFTSSALATAGSGEVIATEKRAL